MTIIQTGPRQHFGKNVPIPERLAARSRDEGGCRVWTGAAQPDGYGRIFFDGKHHGTHRVAYELANGPIPEGLLVRHRCDNPPCINPEHLELGTWADNAQDKVDRDRQARGVAIGKRKITPEQVLEIRAMIAGREATQTDIAAKYGLSPSTVSEIKHGRIWGHLEATA